MQKKKKKDQETTARADFAIMTAHLSKDCRPAHSYTCEFVLFGKFSGGAVLISCRDEQHCEHEGLCLFLGPLLPREGNGGWLACKHPSNRP